MATNTKLWDKDTEAPKPQRQPHAAPTTVLNKHNPNDEDIINKSVLKVDAPEWYPRSYNKPASNSVQNRLTRHKDPQHQQGQAGGQQHQENGDLNSVDMMRLNQIINTLTNDPGQFDNLLDIFLDTLYPFFDDLITLSNAAKLLLAKAISNQNFRYTGARLCYYVEQQCPPFRAELHLQCNKEVKHNQNRQDVLLFVAELYTQLHHDNIYGDLVIESLKQLLALGGNDNVKCVCQALKLTGYSLEKYKKEALDDIFKQLELLRSTVSGSALNLTNAVLALRQQQWGHSTSTDTNSQSDEECYYYEDTPNTVFYNTDGHALSNEESEFLAANMNSNDEYLTDTSDPDELCDPEPEMDEEIQEAFKEFVKLSKR